jgi:DNA-binding IclR family transcriptional regulator
MASRSTGKSVKKTAKTIKYATPALDKGLDILELLAHQSEGLTMSQLARSLQRSVSEIFRMLLCLERRGYIAQVSEERFSLTLKLFQLVQEHPPTERLIADALPVMKRLTFKTGQSCHMGVLDTGKVAILAQVNAPTSIGFYVKLGSTVDLLEAASGYVILAHLRGEERERTLAEWKQLTGKRVPADIERHLDRIRQIGYEQRASHQVKGVVDIGFPICDERGSALGALTIPYIEYGTSPVMLKDVVVSLKMGAKQINSAIGGKTSESHTTRR